jgi:hypothetical protein
MGGAKKIMAKGKKLYIEGEMYLARSSQTLGSFFVERVWAPICGLGVSPGHLVQVR